MTWLSDDPTYLAGGLGLLAGAFLVALRLTQQGRFLIAALVALALAATVLVVEHFWVTDAERIERVVYELRDAVLASDADRLLSHLSADVEYVQEGHTSISGEAARAYLRTLLPTTKFDFLRISQLTTRVFPRSRLGTAEFRVIASGSMQTPIVTYNFGTATSDWSLGFVEAGPRVWKVSRITPTQAPRGMPDPSGRGVFSPGSRRRYRMPAPE